MTTFAAKHLVTTYAALSAFVVLVVLFVTLVR